MLRWLEKRGLPCVCAPLLALAVLASPGPLLAGEDDGEEADPVLRGLNLSPRVQIHGFGNVDALAERTPAEDGVGTETASRFVLGELDLLLTARLGERALFLAETVFEAEGLEGTRTDVERFYFRYDFSDAARIGVGRDHLPLGWWNRAYHHGLLLQPTIARPFVIRFDDRGGPLPIHFVGVQFGGKVSWGPWILGYAAVVSNGRGPRPEEIQNVTDLDKRKGFTARLDTVRRWNGSELRFGVTGVSDSIPSDPERPGTTVALAEDIYGGHVVYESRSILAVTEYYAIRHAREDTADTYRSSGWFALFFWRPWTWKPYAGYDRLDLDADDPYYEGFESERSRWLAGVRYDPQPYVTLKLEARFDQFDGNNGEGLAAQLAFGF